VVRVYHAFKLDLLIELVETFFTTFTSREPFDLCESVINNEIDLYESWFPQKGFIDLRPVPSKRIYRLRLLRIQTRPLN
jgi:hypothetical protein